MPVTQKCRKGTSEWGMSGSANLRKWRVIMKNKKIVQKAGSRFLAMMLSVAMVVPGTAFVPAEYSGAIEALAATIDIAEDFERVSQRPRYFDSRGRGACWKGTSAFRTYAELAYICL